MDDNFTVVWIIQQHHIQRVDPIGMHFYQYLARRRYRATEVPNQFEAIIHSSVSAVDDS